MILGLSDFGLTVVDGGWVGGWIDGLVAGWAVVVDGLLSFCDGVLESSKVSTGHCPASNE